MSDPVEILLVHNHWAMRQMLDACAGLSREQFHWRFEMGPGSLHDTVVHTIAAMRLWADVLKGGALRAWLEGPSFSIEELGGFLEEAAADLAIETRGGGLGEMVERVREGKTELFSRGEVLIHVTTHGVHHRAQCLNMLRHVEVKVLPKSSVADWVRLGRPE